jgi:hypothetical protein
MAARRVPPPADGGNLGPEGEGNRDHRGNSSTAQRARLLAALRAGPVTTLTARKQLDVLHLAARVMELRQSGTNIITHWRVEETQPGRKHRVAEYVLLSGTGGTQ